MSDIVQSFDPSTESQTQFVVPQTAVNGALVFWNESNYSLNITLQNGSKFYLPAWYNKHLCGYSGSVNVSWDVRTILSSGPPPLSEVIVEAYAHGEHFPADGALVRQANGNTNVTTTQNTLINDGSAGGTVIGEATPAGASASDFILDNNGNLTLAGFLHMLTNNQPLQMTDNSGVLHNAMFVSTQNSLVLGLFGNDFQIRDASNGLQFSYNPSNGQLLFNRSGFALIGPSGAVALSTSLVNTHLNGSNASTLQVNGVDVLQALAGSIICDQRLTLSQAGSLTGVTTYNGTTVAGSGVAAAHGMGTTPDICITTINSGSSTTSYSTTWDATNAHVLAAIGGLPFTGIAIKK
jgi:hypothetical protein